MRRSEKGFGFISIAATIAIASLIALGAGMTSLQVIEGTARNEDHAEVIRQAQNLGRWFSRDALAAENITIGDNLETEDEELLLVYWKDWESGDSYGIGYILLDQVDSLKQIKRRQIIFDKNGAAIGDTTTLVAYNIHSANISQQDDTWTLSIEAHSGQKQSVKEYQITQRLD